MAEVPNDGTEVEHLLEDLDSEIPNVIQQKEKKKHFIIPWIPRMYWLFYRRPINFLIFLPSFISSLIMVIADYCVGKVLDGFQQPNAASVLNLYTFVCLFSSLLCSVCQYFSFYGWIAIGCQIGNKARRLLFKSLLEKDVEFFDRHAIGELLVLLTDESKSIEDVFTNTKNNQCRSFGRLISSMFLAFSIDWRLASFSLITTLMSLYIMKSFRISADRHFKTSFKTQASAITIAEESLSNPRIVYSFNRQGKEVERVGFYSEASANHQSIAHGLFRFSMSFSHIFGWATVAVILSFGAFLIVRGSVTAGALYTLTRTVFSIGMEINILFGTFQQEFKGIESSRHLFDIVDIQPSIPPSGGRIIEDYKGNVEFRNVWFKYPTRDAWILKGVSFKLSANEDIAIVGHSGSGKSTILQLLLRFYDVNSGQILLDGIDIKELDPRWLHRTIGIVQQDPQLFSMSIGENILYGKPGSSEEEMEKAAEIANALRFINKLPDRFDTLIGEKGSRLSGGQKQRIAIARAVLKNPPLLITDEATSALDAASEKKVQIALDELMKGRSTIIVAHRLGTIKQANRIIVLESGEILEEGTRDELIQKQGSFYSLVKRQLVSPSLSSNETLSSLAEEK